jgi:AcrR family transcriptional regulator
MPRVTQDHLDARRRLILDAARRCFARNGFRATSMQDVLDESGVSAGGLYRYFSGKEDLVGAIADEALADITSAFRLEQDAEPLPPFEDVIGEMLAQLQRLDEEQRLAHLIVQVWGEAARSPELADRVSETIAGAWAAIAGLVERYRREGLLADRGSPDEVARVVTAIAAGFLVQRAVLGDSHTDMFRAGFSGLAAPAPGR